MLTDILSHHYFWLSFFPIAVLTSGFWLLYFDRKDKIQEPLVLLCLALIAGILSAIFFLFFAQKIELQNFLAKVLGEELFKMLFAILVIESVKQRFRTMSQGIMYGFAVGLGFAMTENIVYLTNIYDTSQFTDAFWLTFQGRFWTTTLLHGATTALFGFFYAGAYLSDTLHKGKKESPLRVFWYLPKIRHLWQFFTLHVARRHLLFSHFPSLKGHTARAVLLEGLWGAILLHVLFNLTLNWSQPILAFLIVTAVMWSLGKAGDRV